MENGIVGVNYFSTVSISPKEAKKIRYKQKREKSNIDVLEISTQVPPDLGVNVSCAVVGVDSEVAAFSVALQPKVEPAVSLGT